MKNLFLILTLFSLLTQATLTQRGDEEEFEHPGEPGSHGGENLEKDCNDGEFHDLESDDCLKCHDICKTCAGWKLNCLSCADGYSFDPLIKTHCLKDGWFVNKFHHLDEILHHVIPDKFKNTGLHHIIKPSGAIMYFLMVVFAGVFFGLSYIALYFYYKFKKGININEMYFSDLMDMLMGTKPIHVHHAGCGHYQEMQ